MSKEEKISPEIFKLDNRSERIIYDKKSDRGLSFYRISAAKLTRINIFLALIVFFFYSISLALILMPKDETLVFSNKSGGSASIIIDN